MSKQAERRNAIRALGALGLAPALSAVRAQPALYPNRPVTLVCGLGVGGMVDVWTRVAAQTASKSLGQSMIVENRAGAGGILGAEYVGRMANGDGYTLIQSSVTMVRVPHMRRVGFDPIADLTWIISLVSVPYVVVVRADSPYKTLGDLIADAKSRPGAVTYGSVGVGSGHHILGEMLGAETGTSLLHVPYKGGGENMNALLSGQTSAAIESSAAFALVDGGRARLLAVFEAQRMTRFPNVPTAVELGHKIVYNSPLGIGGPKNMPPAVVKRVHDAFLEATKDPLYKDTLKKYDLEPAYKGTTEYTAWARQASASEKAWIQKLGLEEKS